jgi:hypothetical protein
MTQQTDLSCARRRADYLFCTHQLMDAVRSAAAHIDLSVTVPTPTANELAADRTAGILRGGDHDAA